MRCCHGITPGVSPDRAASSLSAFHCDSAYSSADVGVHRDAAAGAECVGAVAGGGQGADHHAQVGATVGRRATRTRRRTPPAASSSTSSMICMVRSLGAPVIEPAGNSARSAPTVVDVVAQPPAHRRDELVHARVGLHLHQRRHLHGPRLAHHRQVVAQQVDDHQVLGAELGIRGQQAPQRLVAHRVRRARRGPLDRLGLDQAPALGSSVTSAYRSGLELSSHPARAGDIVLQEPGVRRRVELTQPQVRRHRVQPADLVDPVGQVDLVAVARVQVLPDPLERGGVGGRFAGVRWLIADPLDERCSETSLTAAADACSNSRRGSGASRRRRGRRRTAAAGRSGRLA